MKPKYPVRVVFEDGKAIALIRAISEASAIRHITRKRYEAPIADQDHLITLAGKFQVQDVTEPVESYGGTA